MASLVERLRTRSERRPLYSLDDSDDEASLVRGKSMAAQEKLERIVRPDSVRFCSSSDFSMHHLFLLSLWTYMLDIYYLFVVLFVQSPDFLYASDGSSTWSLIMYELFSQDKNTRVLCVVCVNLWKMGGGFCKRWTAMICIGKIRVHTLCLLKYLVTAYPNRDL